VWTAEGKLAPGRSTRELQFIDVRDVASFTLKLIESEAPGIYNVNGLPGAFTMQQVLEEARSASGSDAAFTWVADEFLMSQDVQPWSEIPLWVPEYDSEDSRGFMFIDVAKALAAGLELRPLSETVHATLEWWRSVAPREMRSGLDPAKESKILRSWASQKKKPDA
jgi:2'-hydroxyisoflavone reductase